MNIQYFILNKKQGADFIKEPKSYTCKDYYGLPDDEKAELINGFLIYNMAPPSRIHQEILGELHYQLKNYIKSKNGKCKVYPAPFSVKLSEENNTIVEPDISVICDPNKLDDRGCNGAPDFIIEIVSPNNGNRDYITKLGLYEKYGVREYWIVNPMKKSILVYCFENDISPIQYKFDDTVKVNIYDDLYIDFKEINKF